MMVLINFTKYKTTISVVGPFDYDLGKAFMERAEEALQATALTVIIDLKKTTYIDSSALGFLLVFRSKANSTKTIIIANASGDTAHILKQSNFERLFIFK